MNQIIQGLKEKFPQCAIKQNEPMKFHTTFKVGGNASLLVEISAASQLQWLVQECMDKSIPFLVIGRGSNLLVSDAGYQGIVIKMGDSFNAIHCDNNEISAQAGATMAKVAAVALSNALAGFEFASGIPGSIGGAVCMNAGAYGGEMKDVVKTVTVLKENVVTVLAAKEMQFAYRKSIAVDEPIIILETRMEFTQGIYEEIKEKMQFFNGQRKEKQPLEYPSAGSTFKRPQGYFAGKLIMDAGLKGYAIGGAQVSEKHAGFIVNKGGATAADIMRLIAYVQKTVWEQFGVQLETEVKMVP